MVSSFAGLGLGGAAEVVPLAGVAPGTARVAEAVFLWILGTTL